MQVASEVGKRLKTHLLRKWGNFKKVSKLSASIASAASLYETPKFIHIARKVFKNQLFNFP